MNIEIIKDRCQKGLLVISLHAEERMTKREITRKEVLEIIIRGEIIEEYPNDWPHPSCLVFGCTVNGRYLHAVVAVEPELLRLVTVYEPDPEIFPDLKHRKV